MWSFAIIFEGTHPHQDASGNVYPAGSPEHALAGKPIAGGWRGAVWIVRGDLEFFGNSLKLEHFASLSPCFCARPIASRMGCLGPTHVLQPLGEQQFGPRIYFFDVFGARPRQVLLSPPVPARLRSCSDRSAHVRCVHRSTGILSFGHAPDT